MNRAAATFLLQVLIAGGVFSCPGVRCPVVSSFASAADHVDGFDDVTTSWRLVANELEVRRDRHTRDTDSARSGTMGERFEFSMLRQNAEVRLESPLPRARAIDDLQLHLWLRSNSGAWRLAVRLVFPHQIDPRTREPVRLLLYGDVYNQVGRWQELTCTTASDAIQKRLIRLRAQLGISRIDTRDLSVDLAVLEIHPQTDRIAVLLDDLQFGPIVSPNTEAMELQLTDGSDTGPPVEFRLGRLTVEGHPFFPRMTPYHGEDASELRDAGINLVWTPDYRDRELLSRLRSQGLWAMATPPRATSLSGGILDAESASLVPFAGETSSILAWYFGTRIPAAAKDELTSWIRQTRNADRRYRRPLMADVADSERVYSRHLSMIGLSRPHVLNTSLSLKDYQAWLTQKRRLTHRGTFTWTWIKTEPTVELTRGREAAGKSPIVIEPEQIRLQVYAALSSECRGIGFWKNTTLDDDSVGSLERRLMMTQLNMELELLEPFLATGELLDRVSFEQPQDDSHIGGASGSIDDGPFTAAVMQTDHGHLVLPVWYDTNAQFVPGPMVARNVTVVVPLIPDTARALEITTTRIRSLETERVAGGRRITLPRFDQTAAIVFTADADLKDLLETKMQSMRRRSVDVLIALAQAKLERVTRVDAELSSLGVGQSDAPGWLAQAEYSIHNAVAALQVGKFDAAREAAQDAMYRMRILQRVHWEHAVRRFASPVATQDTVCFQTLPDYWRMIMQLGQSPVTTIDNRLPTGDFEDIDAMVAAGWRHEQNDSQTIRAAAELYPAPQQGDYCLRLVAVPNSDAENTELVTQPPVTVTTPSIHVETGQIVVVSGWVRVAAATTGGLDGAMLYDSISGVAGALRWHRKGPWQKFQLIREVHEEGGFSLTMALASFGEIHFDALKIVVHDTGKPVDVAEQVRDTPQEQESAPSALDFWHHFNKLRPVPSPTPGT